MNNGSLETLALPDLKLWERLGSRRIPLSFDLELTARCSNNCRHCHINLPPDDPAALKREISFDQLAGIVDAAVSLGALWCLLTGGEPLLRKDFKDIYLYLRKKGLLVSIFTNAALVREEHIRLFQRFPPRDLEITVYGTTERTYEAVTRTPGSFQAFKRGMDRLLKSNLKVRLKAMALRSNCADLGDIRRFCERRTKDYFRVDPCLNLRYDGDALRNRDIISQRLTAEEIFSLEKSDPARLRALQGACRPARDSGPFFYCGAGLQSFAVSYDGRFQLCPALRHPDYVLDLKNGDIEDAWRNFVPRIREVLSRNETFREKCGGCALINLCQWCPANALLETGALDSPVDYFCSVAHARAEAVRSGFLEPLRPIQFL